MKRISICLIMLAACLVVNSCAKKEDSVKHVNDDNCLIPVASESKEATYLLSVFLGHTASDCGGHCVTVGGKGYHFDCMGFGKVCRQIATVTLQLDGTDLTATTTDTLDLTSENFFLMPDRSLNYTDENNNRIFLNIPAQLIWRDSVTRQFTFTGLFFSNTPTYSNY
jgi:hypothetical protein